jgi:hypothetical protein
MLASALLLACQLAAVTPDSTYGSPALASLVERASQSNRRVPQPLLGYDGVIESEIALLINSPAGPDGAVAGTAAATTEAAAQIEQYQMRVSWDRRGVFDQHVIGYRARQLGPLVSAMSIVPKPWTAPALYGDRLALIFGGPPSLSASDSARRNTPAVHPFAGDRDRYYRFTGGDTVITIRAGARSIPVVRVQVEPRAGTQRVMLFAGEVFVDGSTGQMIRMRGRIRLVPPTGESAPTRVVRLFAQVQEVAFIDFENSEQDGRFWLPRRQRIEYQVMTGLTEARATVRVQSTWKDVSLRLRGADTVASGDTLGAPRYTLAMDSRDSTSATSGWKFDLGTQTADASARDFDDVAPPEFRADGSPQWRWQARGLTDLLRVNRVEGLFVGLAGLLEFRHAAPGVAIRMFGGWATSAGTAKGGLEASRVRGPVVLSLRAERQLASTNDFSQALGGGGGNVIGALFGREDNDWVDRRVLSLGLTREIGARHASSLRVEVARGADRGFDTQRTTGFLRGDFRPNRPVTVGNYVRSRVQLDLARNVVSSPLSSGIGVKASYERGDGELTWQRMQLQGLAQRILGRVVLAARTDVGVVAGNTLPTQQLIEVGGAEGLPGYDYKAFAGDRAVIARTTASYLLPLWNAPIRAGRLVLPAVAPQLQVGLFTGRTDATRSTADALRQLGWITTDGWRGSVDVRLRFFSGALSLGASRAVDRRDRWKMMFGFGGAL